jgi:hypothetical protein
MEKCCVFVDGENLRHSIVGLFQGEFEKEEYLPKKADWTSLFDWLVGQVDPDAKRLRTYWYTGARRLNQLTDHALTIKYAELKDFLHL